MFRVVLYAQWKWTRLALAAGTVAGFALPFLSLQRVGDPGLPAGDMLHLVQSFGVLYPALAVTLGLLTAVAAWAPDHRGRHVYALALPLPRWRWAWLRFAAGGVMLLLPIVAVWVSGVVATATAHLPAGIHGYPTWLALRFALAVAVSYSVFFAICASTPRTAGIILGVFAALIVIQVLAAVADVNLRLFEFAGNVMLNWPGPFAIFGGRWMLIDV